MVRACYGDGQRCVSRRWYVPATGMDNAVLVVDGTCLLRGMDNAVLVVDGVATAEEDGRCVSVDGTLAAMDNAVLVVDGTCLLRGMDNAVLVVDGTCLLRGMDNAVLVVMVRACYGGWTTLC